MNFTVVWKPDVEGQLAELWMAARDRAAVTRAADRIDSALGTDPTNAGEGRGPRRRVLFEPPLGVVFRVDEAAREVLVLSVGWSGRPA